MPPAGFEPAISADERPQTYALDRAATETFNISEPLSLFQNSALYSNLNYINLGVSSNAFLLLKTYFYFGRYIFFVISQSRLSADLSENADPLLLNAPTNRLNVKSL